MIAVLKKDTQVHDIYMHLVRRGSITPLEALREYGVMRLAARVHDLEEMGFRVPREPFKGTGRNGRKYSCTRYLRPPTNSRVHKLKQKERCFICAEENCGTDHVT